MCGIIGSVNVPFTDELLDLIRHRGPDDSGLVVHGVLDNQIRLGHRRLAILDLSRAGHQPMDSHCGFYTIVFNGEIYNHQQLRSKLPDIPFRGHSDTETIVNYIATYGIQGVKDFNGIFAFGILDKKNEKIYIARDRYGVKPLYYSFEGNRFIFASEIKPIARAIRPQFSIENLSLLLKLRYNPSPYTLFDNINKLRPGHFCTLDLKKNRMTSESFIRPVEKNNTLSFLDSVKQYGYLFENAIKRQLMSDVDIGMWLSGGLDSALVAHFAVKHYRGKLKTFTVGYPDDSTANELVEARQTANSLGTDHHEVLIDSRQFDTVLGKIITIIEEPLGTTSSIPLYYLNERVSKHVKVVLSGQGADEPLGGYPRYQGELYRRLLPGFFWQVVSSSGKSLFHRKEKISRALYALGEQNVIQRFERTYALFSDDEIQRLIGHTSNRPLETIRYYFDLLQGERREPVEAMMSNDLRMNLADDLLLYGDKISMHFSVEARVPLLDNDLVDFIESLPYRYRLRLGTGKLIHKTFAEASLPKKVIHQKKKGFKAPTDKWFRESIGQKYREILTSENTHFSSYFAPKEVEKVFEQHQSGINKEKQIFTLVSIYHWMNIFL